MVQSSEAKIWKSSKSWLYASGLLLGLASVMGTVAPLHAAAQSTPAPAPSSISALKSQPLSSSQASLASDTGTLRSAADLLSSAVSCASSQGLTVTSSTSDQTPAYQSASSATSSAVASENAGNISLYHQAVSQAASFSSSEVTALSSQTSQYCTAASSFASVASSFASQSTALSESGVTVKVNPARGQSWDADDLQLASMTVLLSSSAALSGALGSEYVVGSLFANSSDLTFSNIENASVSPSSDGITNFTPLDASQPITLTLTHIGQTNTGAAVDAQLQLFPADGETIGLKNNEGLFTQGYAATLQLSLVDESSGSPVSMLVNGQLENINAYANGSTEPNPDTGYVQIAGLKEATFQLPDNITLDTTDGNYHLTSTPVVTNINFFGIIDVPLTLSVDWGGGTLHLNGADSFYTAPTAPALQVLSPLVTPPNLQGTVTLQLTDGTTLLKQISLIGNAGDSYSYPLPNLENYDAPTDSEVTGTFSDGSQTRLIPYSHQTGTITVVEKESLSGQLLATLPARTGNTQTSYLVTPPQISGYRFDAKASSALSGSYQPGNQTLTLNYDKASRLTVQLMEGKKLLKTLQESGYAGDSFSVSLPTLPYFRAPESSLLTGTYTDDAQTRRVNYEPLTGSVTVNVLDAQTGQALQTPITTTGDESDSYQLSAPTLSDYRLDTQKSTLADLTGHYSNGDKKVNLYYDKATTTSLNLIDKTTGKTLEVLTLKGYAGDSYTQTLPTLQYYYLPEHASVTGTYTNAPQSLTVAYSPITSTIIVHYLDAQTGKSLKTALSQSGNEPDAYHFTAPTLSGYRLDTKKSNLQTLTGHYSDTNRALNLYYDKATSVSLKLTDKSTGQTLKVLTLKGYAGDPYTQTLPQLSYYHQPAKSSVSGTYSNAPQSLTVAYSPITSTVTVHYLDAQTGQSLKPALSQSGNEPDAYHFTAPTLSGYRLDMKKSNPQTLTGHYSASNKTIKLYYDKATTVTLQLIGQKAHSTERIQTLTLKGYAGDTYSYTLPHLPNYRLPAWPQVTGTYTNAPQSVAVPYQGLLGTLVINYLNLATNLPLLPSLTLNDTLGDHQLIESPFIDNYTVIKTGNEVDFTQSLAYETRNLYYRPDQDTVIVNFVDNQGNPVRPSENLTNDYGTSQVFKAPPIANYDLATGQVQNLTLHYNQPIQTLTLHYQPKVGSIHLIFENELGQPVYEPETISGAYNSTYRFVPNVPWYLHLTQADQQVIQGKYSAQKQTIVVHYTRLQSRIDVYAVDDRGNKLAHLVGKSYEGEHYTFNMPHFKYLRLVNPKVQHLTGLYDEPNIVAVVEYEHIPARLYVKINIEGVTEGTIEFDGYWGDNFNYKITPLAADYLRPYPGYDHVSGRYTNLSNTITLNYNYVQSTVTLVLYGTDNTCLASYSQTGNYGSSWSFNLPGWIGNYQLRMNSTQSGQFGLSDQTYNIYYAQVVPVASTRTISVSVPVRKRVPKPAGTTGFPEVGSTRWLAKEGQLEYRFGDTKKYLEYSYLNEPEIEAKVVTEYHDKTPALYSGALSVGNSSLAHQLVSLGQTVSKLVTQIKQEAAKIKAKAKAKSNSGSKAKGTTLTIFGALGLLASLGAAVVRKKVQKGIELFDDATGTQKAYAAEREEDSVGEDPSSLMGMNRGGGTSGFNPDEDQGLLQDIRKISQKIGDTLFGEKVGGDLTPENETSTSNLKEIYKSIKNAPKYPKGFEDVKGGTKKFNINDKKLLEELRKEGSGWKKVYKDGYSSSGEEISIHYFQDKSGKVFDVKVKKDWSVVK